MLLSALPASTHSRICYASGVDDSSDESLMLRYGQGDAAAFDALYARHRRGLYAFLHRSLGQGPHLDECFQEVWTRVVAARARYRPEAKFRTWLLQIAHNLLVDGYRRHKPEDSDEEALVAIADQAPQPDQAAESFEMRRRLQMALEQLPLEQRAVIDLRLREELSLEEIAEIAGVGRETIKSRLRYAMDRLRGRLGG